MIETLAQKIIEKENSLTAWYRDRLGGMEEGVPPVYTSVDLRNSGFKISVVDTNLFPSGFNNLCETFSEKASEAFRAYFGKYLPAVKKILIFPEKHTRNLFYWKNIEALQGMIEKAGLEVAVLKDKGDSPNPFQAGDFAPDAILINNDLSGGVPDSLKDVKQVLIPSPRFGWYRRKKSNHFAIYNRLMEEVGRILEIDPWLLSPLSGVETGIDLAAETCLKRLQETADRLLALIRQKYLQHGIRREPYLFVKNNSGTYGLGMIHIDSGKKLLSLSRRLKNKLTSSKGGFGVSEYLLQEGIPTADSYRGKPLEPVVYLIGGEAVGTFFRIHEEKGELDNLNSPGMQFSCLCLHKIKEGKSTHLDCNNKDQLFTVASLLGRVATLAAGMEQARAQKTIAA